jgi:Putative lumazine-binding
MSEQTKNINEADIAAVTDVVRAYYDGSMTGDEAKLASAFHPRACIVGTWEGKLEWQTREEYIAECVEGASEAGEYDLRINGMSFEGDTALVRDGAQFGGIYFSDDLSLVKDDGTWRIVHKTYYAHPA